MSWRPFLALFVNIRFYYRNILKSCHSPFIMYCLHERLIQFKAFKYKDIVTRFELKKIKVWTKHASLFMRRHDIQHNNLKIKTLSIMILSITTPNAECSYTVWCVCYFKAEHHYTGCHGTYFYYGVKQGILKGEVSLYHRPPV